MNIEVTNKAGAVTVKPLGRLDSTTSVEFEERIDNIIDESLSSLTIDMSEVDFISSRGIRVMVSLFKVLGGKEFILLNPNASVIEILDMSGLLNVFTVKQNAGA